LVDTGGKRSLAAIAAAALASPVALAPMSQSMATANSTAVPSEAVSVIDDGLLIRTAQYDPVRKRFIARETKNPHFVPPNPCRKSISGATRRCSVLAKSVP
jgi:hypothetical protein